MNSSQTKWKTIWKKITVLNGMMDENFRADICSDIFHCFFCS